MINMLRLILKNKRLWCFLLAAVCFASGGLLTHYVEKHTLYANTMPMPTHVFESNVDLIRAMFYEEQTEETEWLAWEDVEWDVEKQEYGKSTLYIKEGTVPAYCVEEFVRLSVKEWVGEPYDEIRFTPITYRECLKTMEELRQAFYEIDPTSYFDHPVEPWEHPWLMVYFVFDPELERFRYRAAVNEDGWEHSAEAEAAAVAAVNRICGDDVVWLDYIKPFGGGVDPRTATMPYEWITELA